MKLSILFFLLITSLFADTLEVAKDLFDKKEKYKDAIEIFENYPDDSEAQYYLGKAYLYGMGVDVDKNKALKFVHKSADHNNPSGINLLGALYQDGIGVNKDELEALILYKKAAELGSTKAMKNIGMLYHKGSIVQKNYAKAKGYFLKAVKLGDAFGYLHIGDMYFENKKDKEALKWYLEYEKKVKITNKAFKERVAFLCMNQEDDNNAIRLYIALAKEGYYEPTFNLLDLWKKNRNHKLKDEMIFWLERAADSNYNKTETLGITQLALISYYLYESKQLEKAFSFLEKAYAQGSAEMGCQLASLHSVNPWNQLNNQKSYELSKKIIANNKPSISTAACYSTLGYLYRRGSYTVKDILKTIALEKIIFNEIYNKKNPLIAGHIAKIYLDEFRDYQEAEKWYKVAYDLTKDRKYVDVLKKYLANTPVDANVSIIKKQKVFPILNTSFHKNQVVSSLETKKYYFLSVSDRSVKMYDKKSLKFIREFRTWIDEPSRGFITSMTFDETNKLLYCATLQSGTDITKNEIISVFNIIDGKIIKTINTKKSFGNTYLDVSHDGKIFVALSVVQKMYIINTVSGKTQHYNLSEDGKFNSVKIEYKDNDYLVHVLSDDNQLYTFSVNKKRRVKKAPYLGQVQFRAFNAEHAKNIFKNKMSLNIKNISFSQNKLHVNFDNLQAFFFDLKNLSLSDSNSSQIVDEKKSKVKIIAKNDNRTLEVYNQHSKLLSSIELLFVQALAFKVIDDKYIVVSTSDLSQMIVFTLTGKPIANLTGFNTLQKDIIYNEGYLISYGSDNQINIFNIDNLNKLSKAPITYDQGVAKSIGTLSTHIKEVGSEENINYMIKTKQWNFGFKPRSIQVKSAIKMILIKKENIYPLATLYVRKKDWIIYEHRGLFAANNKGKQLIKYHVSQGQNKEAKVINSSQLFEKFYRPDLLKRKLAKKDIKITLDVKSILLNKKAPSVNIVSYEFMDKKNINVIYEVCDNGSGVSSPTLILNGVSIDIYQSRGFSIETIKTKTDSCYLYKNTITLQAGSNTLSLKAFEKNKMISKISETKEIFADYKNIIKPNLYFLSIAVSKYKNKSLKLKYPVQDVKAIQDKINKKSRTVFKNIFTFNLYDKNVTTKNMADVFDTISRKITVNDSFILYMAGHGVNKEGLYYFLPYNSQTSSAKSIEQNAISLHDIKNNLHKIITNKSLILLDTCQSAALIENMLDTKTTLTRLTHDDNRNYIVASSKNQVALEGYKDHGIFTYAILDAFDYAYFGKQKKLTVTNLAGYVESEVPKLTLEKFHFKQTPEKYLNGSQFIIGEK